MTDTFPQVVTCPFCGKHGTSTLIDHHLGRYYCSCGSLFNGTDTEWRRLAQHRREAAERIVRQAQGKP